MITGLQLPGQAFISDDAIKLFRWGQPDVEEAVATTMKLFMLLAKRNLLAPIADRGKLRTSLTLEYMKLATLTVQGRLYPSLPASISFTDLVLVADHIRPKGVEEAFLWPLFWVPGLDRQSPTEAELNGSETSFKARLALFSSGSSSDSLSHFAGLSFGDKYKLDDPSTQLDELAKLAKFVPAKDGGENFALRAADHRDFIVWVLMDRLRGVSPESSGFALASEGLRVPALGYREMGTELQCGAMKSHRGQLRFEVDEGMSHEGNGIGLTVGIK